MDRCGESYPVVYPCRTQSTSFRSILCPRDPMSCTLSKFDDLDPTKEPCPSQLSHVMLRCICSSLLEWSRECISVVTTFVKSAITSTEQSDSSIDPRADDTQVLLVNGCTTLSHRILHSINCINGGINGYYERHLTF